MKFYIFLILGVLGMQVQAQTQPTNWTLENCVNYALENNLQIQQTSLQAEINKNNLQTAQWDYAPNLNFNATYGWNFGLNIDPVTNQISQTSRQTGNFTLSSSWVLYDGGRKYNSISQRNLQYMSSLYGLEQVKNDISLNVAASFLQIVLNEEILLIAQEQERISELQLKRIQELVNAGARPKGDQLQLEAQLARDRQNRITAENSLRISKLSLANLLQLEDPDDFEIVEPNLRMPDAALIARNANGIYTTALENQPSIKAAEVDIESSQKAVQVSQSGYLPTLSLIGQVGTSYSDRISQATGTTEQTVPIGVIPSTGEQVVTLSPQTIPTGFEQKPFGAQVEDNINEFVGIQLQVPIFNRFSVRNGYQIAKINKQISELQLEQAQNNLRQTIYQAHADARASYNTYLAAEIAVGSSTEAFNYAQERFQVGALNQYDFENSKNDLARAQSEMLRAKFDYIFKVKVLEFYLTNQVSL